MRRLRRLLLVAISVVLAVVAVTYSWRKAALDRLAPVASPPLPLHIQAEGRDWVYTHHEGDRPRVEVRAARMRQIDRPAELELEGVELRLFDQDGLKYDHVKSAFARFDTRNGDLYSDAEVEITLGVPLGGPPPDDPVIIRASGVHFDTSTGKAVTDRPAWFRHGRAEGKSVGASYDPAWSDLRMHAQVELRWLPARPDGKPMTIEAGQLVYKQDQAKVYLSPWSRLKRGNLTLEAAESVVTLERDTIQRVDAQRARGRDRYPRRTIEFAADKLAIEFGEGAVVQKIVGEQNAQLVAVSEADQTSVASDQIFLDFRPAGGDSVLESALAMGGSRLESQPRARPGSLPPETRLLRAEVIKTLMRPEGDEIETIETHTPGTVEFIPNRPEQRRRRIDGERLWIHFGPDNRIRAFRAIQVATRSEPAAAEQRKSSPSLTWSQDLLAQFDPASGKLLQLEQWGEFRYQEGSRRAVADKGTLDEARDTLALSGKARVWDETGSTAADELILARASGDLTAAGNVRTTRLDDKKAASDLLASGEPVHATARRMVAANRRTNIVYEGDAVLWQGANRLRAERIEIDRNLRRLSAAGNVTSQLLEKANSGAAGDGEAPKYLLVQAAEMVYVEPASEAHYRENVRLRRGALEVAAHELRAHFSKSGEAQSGDDSEMALEWAAADGQVTIIERQGEHTRVGSGEHAEYYAREEKIVLNGGRPKLVDSIRGTTEGRRLTYFARNDRLLVEGAEAQPAVTRLRRN
jgi:lipopolysaccharide export system protein LptA